MINMLTCIWTNADYRACSTAREVVNITVNWVFAAPLVIQLSCISHYYDAR